MLPGFVDGHIHTGLSLLRGEAQDVPEIEWMLKTMAPFTRHRKPEYGIKGSALGVLEALKAGTTTFGEIGGDMGPTAEEVFMPFTVGGGIRNVEDMRRMLLAGADKVSINTAAVEQPERIREGALQFGSQCVVVAIDAKWRETPKTGSLWEVYLHGGRTPTDIDALGWAAKAEELGAGEILLTSMNTDGTKDGYDIELTRAVAERVGIPVIASGGAGNLEHLYDALTEGKADAALVASIFHYGEYTVKEAHEYLRGRGVEVRE